MPLSTDYSKHNEVLILIENAQAGEKDQRNDCKESKLFLSEKDGQWEQRAREKMLNRYRGTFDMCSPIVEAFEGELINADFTIRVSPASGKATKETAKVFDGIIRNSRNISDAETIFNKLALSNYICGFDCFEIVQEYVDANSFDQDLLFKSIANAMDSVWFDPLAIRQDKADANWGIKLVTIPKLDYDARWPDGGAVSIGDNAEPRQRIKKTTNDTVTIGQLYYKKETDQELVQMTDGSVYEVNEKFEQVVDDLKNPTDGSVPVTIELDSNGNEKRRTRKLIKVHSRMLDGSDWLEPAGETVFTYIPLCPIYGNYDIIDKTYVYYGRIRKLMDPQRAFSYAKSREIEDVALGPSEKIAMTTKQIGGNDYSKLNTERDPIFEYDVDTEAPAPYKMASMQPNLGLQSVAASMQNMISTTANSFQAQQGNANAVQSGIAGIQQIEQANINSVKYMQDLSIALCYAAKVMIPAIPLVYDGKRQTRLLSEDGTSDVVVLNEKIFDSKTRTNVVLNDLALGKYDAICEMGPAFNSAQKEAARSFEALMLSNPELASRNTDIYLKNRTEPGFNLMAERERVQNFNAGLIPESQWTDEEKERIELQRQQAQGQPPQEDPNMVLAKAEEGKALADQQNAQTKQQEAQFNAQVKLKEIALDNRKLDIKEQEIQLDADKFKLGKDDEFNVAAAKIDQAQQKIDMDAQRQQFDEFIQVQQLEIKTQMDEIKLQSDTLKTEVETWKLIREAGGADAVITQAIPERFEEQGEIVHQAQHNNEV